MRIVFSQTFLTLFFPFASKIEIQDRETASCNGFRFFYENTIIQLFLRFISKIGITENDKIKVAIVKIKK